MSCVAPCVVELLQDDLDVIIWVGKCCAKFCNTARKALAPGRYVCVLHTLQRCVRESRFVLMRVFCAEILPAPVRASNYGGRVRGRVEARATGNVLSELGTSQSINGSTVMFATSTIIIRISRVVTSAS